MHLLPVLVQENFLKTKNKTAEKKFNGAMFSREVQGHMQKLSSFGRGQKFALKSHLRACCTKPFNYFIALLSPQGTDFISGLKRGGLVEEGGLIERGGLIYLKSYTCIFDKGCIFLGKSKS